MWPSRDAEDGEYASVTLSQRKAPYETMPMPDPDPPFLAELEPSATSVRFSFGTLECAAPPLMDTLTFLAWQVTGKDLQMAFTRPVSFRVVVFFLCVVGLGRYDFISLRIIYALRGVRPRRAESRASSGRSAARRQSRRTRTWTSRSTTSSDAPSST
jgi:hypothetical protein